MLNDQTSSATAVTPEAPVAPAAPDEVVGEATDATAAPNTASADQIEGLVVLSQAPLTLDDALEQESDRLEVSAPPLTAGSLITQYAGLAGQMLGVGLITAAVRHYGAEPNLYLGVGFGGALLFAIASTLAQRPASGGVLGRLGYAGLSLLLGLGLGLLVGGVMHFSAFPHTGVVLVPLGVALSTAAFVVRDGRALIGRNLISAGVTFAGLLVWLSVGLGMAAKKMDPPATPSGNSGAVAGTPAAADHGATAAADHGATAAADHGATATADHGATATADHGATAAADHSAPAAAKASATGAADHGAAAAKDSATATADHSASAGSAASTAADAGHATKTTDHAATKTADHAATTAKADHGAAATGTHAAGKTDVAPAEDEVTADDVLAH